MSYVLDTNVMSELARPTPNRAVVDWFATQRNIALSAVSIEELAYGIARARLAERRRLAPWFEALLAIPAQVPIVSSRTLVTRNTRDFEGCGVAIFDPFV